ncbi:LPO_1073/Vpar_1526 family protein [Cellulosimicrobium cellulans]|uniref:LPO_1073/Vpar_1526 family protein n=1 Tax=Cellulosimicrobium cellulans TaxID=1710 RepID=UPI0036EE36C0
MTSGQSQRAGAGAQQIQVMGDLKIGIDEVRARDIAREQARLAIEEYAGEARAEADARIARFDEMLLERMHSDDLGAFAEPDFQVALRRTQIEAATSPRESDWEKLATLLGDRVHGGASRVYKAALDTAIEAAARIDEGALAALSATNAALMWFPTTGDAGGGIALQSSIISPLVADGLPSGADWLDHLESLGLVRTIPARPKPLGQVLTSSVPGYVCVGVESGSEAERQINASLEPFGVTCLVPHRFKPGYFRMPYRDFSSIAGDLPAMLRLDLHDLLLDIAENQVRIDSVDNGAIDAYMREFASRPELSEFASWWEKLSSALRITAAGKAMAYVHARKVVPDVPVPNPIDSAEAR